MSNGKILGGIALVFFSLFIYHSCQLPSAYREHNKRALEYSTTHPPSSWSEPAVPEYRAGSVRSWGTYQGAPGGVLSRMPSEITVQTLKGRTELGHAVPFSGRYYIERQDTYQERTYDRNTGDLLNEQYYSVPSGGPNGSGYWGAPGGALSGRSNPGGRSGRGN